MKKYIYIIVIFVLVLKFSNCVTYEFVDKSLYTIDKFIIKTKFDIPISEATGSFSTVSGIQSLDDKNLKYKIKKIKQIFRLNNGNSEIYKKLEMSRYYLLYLDGSNNIDIADIIKDYSADSNLVFCEPDFIGISAGEKGYGYEGSFAKSDESLIIPNDEKNSK